MGKLSRTDVLSKSITVFEAIRRMASKGNAGLEPERGAEEEFSTVDECIRIMKEWMREIQAGGNRTRVTAEDVGFNVEEDVRQYGMEELGSMLQGNPLITAESIEAARSVDEARDRIIDQIGRLEPNAPKVVELKEWQRLAAVKPPERLDFDEDS